VFSTPSVNPVVLESDTGGNVYTCSGSLANFAVAARLDSAGVETQLFSGSGQFHGIDADAAGNVYIGQLIGSTTRNLLKFAPNGALLNTTPLGFIGPSDIAIDEVGKRLFMADPNNNGVGIKIFDISGAAPVLMGSITTPLGAFVLGVHYAAESGNVFAIDSGVFDSNPRGFEFSPGGALIAEYRPANIIQARDIITFVPEPSSAGLLFLETLALALMRRIARRG
jgi:DNA-binding beta-propeller fold protein YncE